MENSINIDPRLSLPWYRLTLSGSGTLLLTPLNSTQTSLLKAPPNVVVCRDGVGDIHHIPELLFKRLARRTLLADLPRLLPAVNEELLRKRFESSPSWVERFSSFFKKEEVSSPKKGSFGTNVHMKVLRHARRHERVD